MKQTNICLAIIVIAALAPLKAFSQIDTIQVHNGDLRTTQLKEGLHQYLVYFENPKKQRVLGHTIWSRQVKFRKKQNEGLIEIVQKWLSSDTLYNRYVYSICNKKTFAPVFHKSSRAGMAEAFDFDTRGVHGSDTVRDNNKADFEVALKTPTLNWELDLEIFASLPIKKVGQRFIINFYHPGGKIEPQYYEYVITGSEKIDLANNNKADCWMMKINYDTMGKNWAIFWISKKSHEVLKMQEFYGTGYRYKIKLTPVKLTFEQS